MNINKTISALALIAITTVSACSGIGEVKSTSKPIDHTLWNQLLQANVTTRGVVNYKGIIKDSIKLNTYLKLLETHHPNDANWSKEQQLAYWINAYNAFTVRLIIRGYPVKSIKDLGGSIYRINTPWARKFIRIEGHLYSLDNIEHDILRKKWHDPRIHFSIVCASYSCPRLRNEAFTAPKLDRQLTEEATYFVNNPYKNKITPTHIYISKLFSWFRGDFTANGTLIEFLNKYSKVKINADADIDYRDYSWELNEKSYK